MDITTSPTGDFVTNSLSDEALDTPGTCKREVGSSNYSMGTRIKKRLKLAEDELSRQVNDTTKSKGNQRISTRRDEIVFNRGKRRREKHTYPLLPLRRSKREKRLTYANFTPREMNRTILNPHSINIIDSSEEEMEPYEKLLSPMGKKMRKFERKVSAHHYLTRSSHQLNVSTVWKHEDNDDKTEHREEKEDEDEEVEEQEEEEEQEEDEEDEEEGEDDEEDEEVEDEETGYYNLRKRRPVLYQYQPVIQVVDNKPRQTKSERRQKSYSLGPSAYQSRKNRHAERQAHQYSSTSESEDSDEAKFQRRKARSMKRARNECLPMNFTPEDLTKGTIRDRVRVGASLADVSPMTIDRSINFNSIGGLKHHLRALKEMIVFPLLYPEVFDKFQIAPPRGVLFHGAPGCGKTLVARALANECAKDGRNVAFFMRKGADCLSKWVGESERQLRLLFDQAYQMRPSIIFFDEIDGLAPVRSTRQDQIHSSIVSTLLALMDGLDSRGEIVIIGATNRIDAIDPALRRPGRFDREFIFPLPSRQDRYSILQIHTKSWDPPLQDGFLQELSELTVGYCGADLKALCTEAALHSLRRRYPQIYNTSDKLIIDVSKINISSIDFHLALKVIVPTAQRSNASVSQALSDTIFPLLGTQFEAILKQLVFLFPSSWKSVQRAFDNLKRRFEAEKKKRDMIGKMCMEIRRSNSYKENGSGMSHDLTHSKSLSTDFQRPVRPYSTKRSHSDSSVNLFPLSSNQFNDVYFDLQDEINISESVKVNKEHDTETSLVDSDHVTSSGFLSLLSHPHILPPVHRPRLLLTGKPGMGQSDHLSLAILNACEELPVKLLDINTMFASVTQSPEETCIQVFREARRVVPCIVYIPRITACWNVMSDTFKATFTSVINTLPHDLSMLILATSECLPADLPQSLQQIFPVTADGCYLTTPPSLDDRRCFFYDVIMSKPLCNPPSKPLPLTETEHEPLPVAPAPPPRELSQVESDRVTKQREAVLRELRVFLRDATNKLLAERKFKEFTKPVNSEEVPDYYEIIVNPMDLSTVMKKIDEHSYTTPKQWIKDIDLITINALEYNPEHDPDSRLLRHRASALQDLAHSIFDHELSEDFEQQCEDIEATFAVKSSNASPLKNTPNHLNTPSSVSSSGSYITPKESFMNTGKSKTPVGSGHSTPKYFEPMRRSLRRLGVKPDSGGMPYYPPPKPKTPKKEDEEENTIDGERNEEEKVMEDVNEVYTHDVINDSIHEENSSSLMTSGLIRRLSFDNKINGRKRSRSESEVSPDSLNEEEITLSPSQDRISKVTNDSTIVELNPSVSDGSNNDLIVQREVVIDKTKLLILYKRVISLTDSCNTEQCLKLHSTLNQLVFRHRMVWNRQALIEDFELAIDLFKAQVLK